MRLNFFTKYTYVWFTLCHTRRVTSSTCPVRDGVPRLGAAPTAKNPTVLLEPVAVLIATRMLSIFVSKRCGFVHALYHRQLVLRTRVPPYSLACTSCPRRVPVAFLLGSVFVARYFGKPAVRHGRYRSEGCVVSSKSRAGYYEVWVTLVQAALLHLGYSCFVSLVLVSSFFNSSCFLL